jgi:hypothetical protein
VYVAPNATYTSGVGYASAFSNAHFGFGFGFGHGSFGCRPYCFDPFWSLPHWPVCSTWYGGGYHSPWFGHCGGYYGYPFGYGSSFSFGYWSNRWAFGFGSYAPCSYSDCWYPSYRVYRYYPYYYYSTAAYYPAYSSVYVSDGPDAVYVDSSDPYVEFSDEAPEADAAVMTESSLPDAFEAPLVAEYPAGLSEGAYLDRAKQEFLAGRYWDSSEARRRAWAFAPGDPERALGTGYALFAAGRYDLAAEAFRAACKADPSVASLSVDYSADFRSATEYRAARAALERRVVTTATDADARYVLAMVDYWSGDWFGARNEFSALGDSEPCAARFREEAERRLLATEK